VNIRGLPRQRASQKIVDLHPAPCCATLADTAFSF